MTRSEYYQKNKEVIDARNKLWRNKNRDKVLAIAKKGTKRWIFKMKNEQPEKYKQLKKNQQERHHFGRTREELFALLGNKCDICGKIGKLDIHHIDGKGTKYKHEEKNNNLNNLQVLCKKCCRREDARRINEKRKDMWTLHYSECVICKKTDSKHVSFGICNRCYQKTRRRYKREYWRKHYGKQGVDNSPLTKY